MQVKIKPRVNKLPMQLHASLGDPKLPKVPPLKMVIPIEYPDESPILIDFKTDYGILQNFSCLCMRVYKWLLMNIFFCRFHTVFEVNCPIFQISEGASAYKVHGL